MGFLFPSCLHLYYMWNPSLFRRTCLLRPFSRLFGGDESLGVMETSDLFVHPQSESPQDSLQDGDSSICASVCAEQRLDGLRRFEGCFLASSNTSKQSQVPQFCRFESSISVQALCFGLSMAPQVFTRVMAPVSAILHRLGIRMCRCLDDWLIQAPSRSLVLQSLETVVHPCQDLGIIINWEKVQSPSIAASGLPGCYSGFHSFQGFFLPTESREAMLNCGRISVLRRSASFFVAKASLSPIILDSAHSRRQAEDSFPSASSSTPVGSERLLHLNSVRSGLSLGLRMVACSRSSPGRLFSGPGQPSPRLLVSRLGYGVGYSPPGHNCFRPLVSAGS